MPPESDENLRLEIGYVLFLDIVGYSKLLIEEQKERLNQLTAIVLATKQVGKSTDEQLVRLPTGDGMALVFRHSVEEPARCALEIAEALRQHPEIPLRMGIHSGPVSEVTDVSGRKNIAGAGINMAQRVMDCGDAGHILVSQRVAEDLAQYRQWAPRLHDLGPCEVKHGVRLELTNLYSDEAGNPKLPSKLGGVRKQRARTRWAKAAIGLVILGAMIGGGLLFLRNAREAPLGVTDKSIAVLPFVDLSQGKDQEYFSDGVAEELLNLLAKVPQLKVAARTSSFSFKGKGIELPEIARRLHVANVLEGSVRKSGNQVRITVQLIRATEGFHLWSETYDRDLNDIFKIQDDIANEVVNQLKVKLLGAMPKTRKTSPEAYSLYLQGTEIQRRFTAEAFTKSSALFRQALAIDPRYVPAWIGIAVNFENQAVSGSLASEEGWSRAREAVENALAIDPDYAQAHSSLGYIAMYGANDLAAAAGHFERALVLDPSSFQVVGNAAILVEQLGRLDEALALKEAVVRHDPVNLVWLANLAELQRRMGRYDAAIESYHTLLSLSQTRAYAHSGLGSALLLKGDARGALAEFEQDKSDDGRLIGLALAYHSLGRRADSDSALNTLIAKYEQECSYNIAYVYAFRGEADKAFEWLDKAIRYSDSGLADAATENLFANIHSDPRWLPFLRKIGRAPEQLSKIRFKVSVPQ